jgi:hypothetical protein
MYDFLSSKLLTHSKEEIWRAWVEQGLLNACPYQAELYIHAKFPERIRSPWVRSRTLTHSYRPEWNSPEVIRAMLAVLEKALTNKSNGRFVFATGNVLSSSPLITALTESCIPICSLQETGDELFQQDVSWADAYQMPKDNYEQQYCFHAVDPSIIPPKVRLSLSVSPLTSSLGFSLRSLRMSGRHCLAGSC